MRFAVSVFVGLVMAAIAWTWFWMLPQCLESGAGTPGYWSTARSVTDDQGPLGCWWGGLTRDRMRAQAFEEWARQGERLERERRGR
ncbi:MAG: hypothetical protein JO058_10655 [Alphaproteobacteria bacterium]|nr:hypothetical protein [Alphaproteobacteria bacterium]